MSRYWPIEGVNVVSITPIENSLAYDLRQQVKQHIREEQTNQDMLIVDYIGAAIEAAENYLQKDILPRTYVLNWYGGSQIQLTYGAISAITAVQGNPPLDVLPAMSQRGSTDFRSAGFSLFRYGLGAPTYDPVNATLLGFTTGFTDAAQLPRGIVVFIYAFAAMLYELRELSNVGTVKYNVDDIPVYLLRPLRTEVIA